MPLLSMVGLRQECHAKNNLCLSQRLSPPAARRPCECRKAASCRAACNASNPAGGERRPRKPVYPPASLPGPGNLCVRVPVCPCVSPCVPVCPWVSLGVPGCLCRVPYVCPRLPRHTVPVRPELLYCVSLGAQSHVLCVPGCPGEESVCVSLGARSCVSSEPPCVSLGAQSP
jgi:hypothetical protein